MLVAPVTIGDGAKTGAGAVVTHDVPPGGLVVGVPARPMERRRADGTAGAVDGPAETPDGRADAAAAEAADASA